MNNSNYPDNPNYPRIPIYSRNTNLLTNTNFTYEYQFYLRILLITQEQYPLLKNNANYLKTTNCL